MGLYYLYQHYGGGGMSKYYFEEYNVLGDSSVKIWRGQSNSTPTRSIPDKPTGPATGEIGLSIHLRPVPQMRRTMMCTIWSPGGIQSAIGLARIASGETVSLKHTWTLAGDYSIKVKAKDSEGLESGWSDASLYQLLLRSPH